jgi:hypothetical protein
MLGNYIESSITSDNIKVLINNERPSLLTVPDKIIILLATISEQAVNLHLLRAHPMRIQPLTSSASSSKN